MSEPIHVPFPEIGQFRQTVRAVCERATFVRKDELTGKAVYDHLLPKPTLEFTGTVKLHGTNAAIIRDPAGGGDWFQSRERVLAIDYDNAGFFIFASKLDRSALFEKVANPAGERVAIFGEWCGQGIIGGTAIAQFPRMFVVFACRVGERWLGKQEIDQIYLHEARVFNVEEFQTYQVKVDFEHPELSQNAIGELTKSVEANCPAAKYFGADGLGEGIVWRCSTPGWESSRYWFKVKGEKHSATKVTKLAEVDLEAVKGANEFVEKVVTDARCRQGIAWLRENGKALDVTSMGDFLRWVFKDVAKEEADLVITSGLDLKKMGGAISLKAKRWFFENEKDFPI